jgi:hypothetical protein
MILVRLKRFNDVIQTDRLAWIDPSVYQIWVVDAPGQTVHVSSRVIRLATPDPPASGTQDTNTTISLPKPLPRHLRHHPRQCRHLRS